MADVSKFALILLIITIMLVCCCGRRLCYPWGRCKGMKTFIDPETEQSQLLTTSLRSGKVLELVVSDEVNCIDIVIFS